jgi:Ion channel
MNAEATPATAAPRWRPGSRVERLRASRSFGFVFLLVVGLFLITAALPDTGWARSVILLVECGLLATATWTSGVWQDRRATAVLLALGVAAAVLQIIFGGDTSSGVVAIFQVALLLATMIVILVGVIDQHEVNAQSILGALSNYVLLGMLFVFVYSAAAALGSGPFFAQGTDGTLATRLYFSYVTLATLGYGDYTAADNFGRTASVVEAMIGQIYLVTVVALLVGQLVGRRRRAADG